MKIDCMHMINFKAIQYDIISCKREHGRKREKEKKNIIPYHLTKLVKRNNIVFQTLIELDVLITITILFSLEE